MFKVVVGPFSALLAAFSCVLLLVVRINGQAWSLSDYRSADAVRAAATKACPPIFSNDLPTAVFNNFTDKIRIHFHFNPLHVDSINDVAQIFVLSGEFRFNWTIPVCQPTGCSSVGQSEMGCEPSRYRMLSPNNQVWSPRLMHKNAVSDTDLFKKLGGNVETSVLGMPAGFKTVSGQFETKCTDFRFRRFPFEAFTCHIVFEAEEPPALAEYSVSTTEPDRYLLVSNSLMYSFKHLESKVEVVRAFEDDWRGKTRITISLTMNRKYHYYIAPLYLPIWCYLAIQVVIVFIVQTHERTGLCFTICLGFTLLNEHCLGMVPHTAESNPTSIMIEAHYVFCMWCAGYTIISSALGEWPSFQEVKPKFGDRTLIRVIDLCFITISTTLMMILDIILFCIMNGTNGWDM